MPANIASVAMPAKSRSPRRAPLLGVAESLGRSICRAAEWVSDGAARIGYDRSRGMAVLAELAPGLTPHMALAGAVEVAALALDLTTASAVAAPVVAIGTQAITMGLATDAAMRVARRHGADRARARAVLALSIAHAERRQLCSSYEAHAWRVACRLPRSVDEAGDGRSMARAVVKDSARAVLFAALVKALPKSAMKRAPWVPVVIRLARLPETLMSGVRLVAAVEQHAELLCGAQRGRRAVPRRDVNRGATPARAARTVEPLFTIAATPGVMRPSAPSPIAAAFGAITRARPRRTLAIA
jgi:hypothetical protein